MSKNKETKVVQVKSDSGSTFHMSEKTRDEIVKRKIYEDGLKKDEKRSESKSLSYDDNTSGSGSTVLILIILALGSSVAYFFFVSN